MNDCEKVNWGYFTQKPSEEVFRLMKDCSHKYPFKPQKRRFKADEPFFYYHREELMESDAKVTARVWRNLGFNARITTTKERGGPGVKHGSWLRGHTRWHVWVGEKRR